MVSLSVGRTIGIFLCFCLRFLNGKLTELYFADGGDVFPNPPFTPKYEATGNWAKEFLSLYGENGNCGSVMKSNWGLARPNYTQFSQGFTLYRISFTREISESFQHSGPTCIEPRRTSASLDAHIKLSTNLDTNCEFVCMFVYNDRITIQKTDVANRGVTLSYPL